MSIDLVKLASEPISAENPAGAQIKDDSDFDKVNKEIRKIGSLYGEVVDWGEVVEAGTAVLTQKSKDLKIASYFCMGLFQEQGYSGLSMGLEIYINLLDHFWETLYPKRIKGRIGAVEWLSDRVAPAVARKEPAADEAKAVQACAEHAEKLIQIVDEKFGNGAPSLAALRKAIQTYAANMKVEEPPAPADGEQVKQPSTVPIAQTETEKSLPLAAVKIEQAGQPPATPIVPPQMEVTSENQARQFVLRAATFLRESQPTDSLPYRLSRVMVWHAMTLPSANNGKTRIAGILPQMVQGFQNLLDSAQWDKLLRQAEIRFPDSPLWLDLQRFIDYAMEGLGEGYQDARQVVREELGALVRRLPEIVELQFQNGIPFADDRTKMWIDTEVLPSVETTASTEVAVKAVVPAVEGDAPSDDGHPDQVVAEARRLTAGGKFKDALSLLLERLASAPMRREQFLWKLRLAKLCLEAGHPRLALPQLQSLDDEIRQFSLEQWEPSLSVDVVRTLLQCQRKLMQDAKRPPAEIVERTNELYARLCRLDVLSAVALDGGS